MVVHRFYFFRQCTFSLLTFSASFPFSVPVFFYSQGGYFNQHKLSKNKLMPFPYQRSLDMQQKLNDVSFLQCHPQRHPTQKALWMKSTSGTKNNRSCSVFLFCFLSFSVWVWDLIESEHHTAIRPLSSLGIDWTHIVGLLLGHAEWQRYSGEVQGPVNCKRRLFSRLVLRVKLMPCGPSRARQLLVSARLLRS